MVEVPRVSDIESARTRERVCVCGRERERECKVHVRMELHVFYFFCADGNVFAKPYESCCWLLLLLFCCIYVCISVAFN